MQGCYNDKIAQGGFLYGYMMQEEWCDESPWRIENVRLALEELALFSEENIPEMDIMHRKLRDIQQKLLNLLKHASEHGYDVYIEYN